VAFKTERSSALAGRCSRLRTELKAALSSPQSSAQVHGLTGKLADDLYATRTGQKARIAQADAPRQALLYDEWDRWASGYSAQVMAATGCS
jgi:hypothetical protein